MLWFVRQSLVLLVLAWVLGLATGFLLFGRRRGWAEPVTDVIPVIAEDADPDGEWADEGWVAADAEDGLRAALEDDLADLDERLDAAPGWRPVGADWDPVPAHHDYADPVWAAEAGITDDVLARQADDAAPAAPVVPAAPATPAFPVVPVIPVVPAAGVPDVPAARPAAQVVVPRPSAPEPAVAPRAAAPRAAGDGDDLTRIDGVTAETATALHASGLRTFTAVSRATTDDLRAALSAAGLAPTFKAAYWPLIAADLARAAAAEPAAEPVADPVADPVAEPVADGAPEPVAGPAADATDEPGAPAPAADAAAEQPVTVDVTDAASTAVDVTDAASAPVDVTDPVDGFGLDDLERIDGVTLKIAIALRDAGITTFTELAEAPHAQLRQALTAAGLRIAPTLQTWGAQARRLAAESDAALAARITAGGSGARL